MVSSRVTYQFYSYLDSRHLVLKQYPFPIALFFKREKKKKLIKPLRLVINESCAPLFDLYATTSQEG